ncbi:MAG TPA: hypothetical protein VFE23_06640 [Usitatibacter sp.]|jgi:hypothetical protein|nr:hypothetical protein [Usitatibacter sp.]
MNKNAAVLAAAAGFASILASTAAIAATECNGPPLTGTYNNGVVVNAGDFCVLGGATVRGGVRVNPGGVLITCGSTINGGIVANGALNLILGAGADEEVPPVNFVCPGNVIRGGVQVSNTGPGILAPAPSISLERAHVEGDVLLLGNAGPIMVSDNVIHGSLVCSNNRFVVGDEGNESTITGAVQCEFDDE